jgi:hypothetical protein
MVINKKTPAGALLLVAAALFLLLAAAAEASAFDYAAAFDKCLLFFEAQRLRPHRRLPAGGTYVRISKPMRAYVLLVMY